MWAPKSPNNVTSTCFNTEHLLPKDIRFKHGGAKLASCPGRHLTSLCLWEWWILQQTLSLPYPVTSHWWVSILDRICYMKTWYSTLKSFPQLKLIASPDKYFLFLWNSVYAFLGSHYCIPKQWPMGPLQLRLPPLAETSSYATDSGHLCLLVVLDFQDQVFHLTLRHSWIIAFHWGVSSAQYTMNECTFVSRHEVHSTNTHFLYDASW